MRHSGGSSSRVPKLTAIFNGVNSQDYLLTKKHLQAAAGYLMHFKQIFLSVDVNGMSPTPLFNATLGWNEFFGCSDGHCVFGLGFSFFDVLFFLSFFFNRTKFSLALLVRFCRNNSLILLRAIKTCGVTADFFFFFFFLKGMFAELMATKWSDLKLHAFGCFTWPLTSVFELIFCAVTLELVLTVLYSAALLGLRWLWPTIIILFCCCLFVLFLHMALFQTWQIIDVIKQQVLTIKTYFCTGIRSSPY